MSTTRLAIIFGCGFNLLRSAKVAIRYGVCRRQFANQKGSKLERKLLDYQIHQETIAKNMSNGIAIVCISKAIKDLHTRSMKEFEDGNFDGLDLLHHLTAGVKSLATEMCYVGLDELRQCCGGAGFLLTSGLADWWSDIAPFPTFEGVNPVMAQQAARLIFKSAKKVTKGKAPHPFFAYLSDPEKLVGSKNSATTVADFQDKQQILRMLAIRAIFAIRELDTVMRESGLSQKEMENDVFALDITRVVRLHLIYAMFKIGLEYIEKSEIKSAQGRKHVETALKIFALKQLTLDHQSLYESGYFTKGSARLLHLAYTGLLN